LNQLDGTGSKADNLVALTSDTAQDFVVPSHAPAPPGLVLASLGALTLLIPWTWRHRKQLFLCLRTS
jgi:hypothetical protein